MTRGVGWDAGYHSRAELKEMWSALGPDSLALPDEAAGRMGRAAQVLISELRVIDIREVFHFKFLHARSMSTTIRLFCNCFQGSNASLQKSK